MKYITTFALILAFLCIAAASSVAAPVTYLTEPIKPFGNGETWEHKIGEAIALNFQLQIEPETIDVSLEGDIAYNPKDKTITVRSGNGELSSHAGAAVLATLDLDFVLPWVPDSIPIKSSLAIPNLPTTAKTWDEKTAFTGFRLGGASPVQLEPDVTIVSKELASAVGLLFNALTATTSVVGALAQALFQQLVKDSFDARIDANLSLSSRLGFAGTSVQVNGVSIPSDNATIAAPGGAGAQGTYDINSTYQADLTYQLDAVLSADIFAHLTLLDNEIWSYDHTLAETRLPVIDPETFPVTLTTSTTEETPEEPEDDDVTRAQPDASLMLYFSFDELNGNQTIDHSQHGNHGHLVGTPKLVAGKFGNALEFNGESDYVEVPHDDSLTVAQDVTVMAWIHTPRHHGPKGMLWQGIIAKGNNPRSYSFYTEHGGALHLSVNNFFGSDSEVKVALNEWQHVVAQVDNGVHRYWINGKNAGFHRFTRDDQTINPEGQTSLPGTTDRASVRIGNTHDVSPLPDRHFLGRIDEVRVWNRALSESEILEQMRMGSGEIAALLPIENGEVVASGGEMGAAPIVGDINGDGVVNIQDLVLVANNFGQTGQQAADVNGDGVVNIADLVKVAGAIGGDAAAPAAMPAAFELFSTAEVQQWLVETERLSLTDAMSQRGVRFLKQLLAILTLRETVLLANYPNPFNPETWLPYRLAEPAEVTVRIYAANGSLIRVLALGHLPAGIYEGRSRAAYWDGRNALGEPVASGVYFYTLQAGEFTATRKMLIRK